MRRLALALYRRLLGALRPDLAPVADELVETVGDRLDGRGRVGAARIWGVEVADLLRGGIERRWIAWVYDVAAARRGIRRAPFTAALVVASVAGGVAALTAAAALLAHVVVDGLPYPEAHRLVSVAAQRDEAGAGPRALRVVEWEAYRDAAASGTGGVESVGASWRWTTTLTGAGGPRRIPALRVTPGWFETLGAEPRLGRFPGGAPDDETEPRVVVSWGLWSREFGGDDRALGRTLVLDGTPHTVVGVAPRGFRPPDGEAEVFVHHGPGTEGWIGRWLDGVARVAPGTDLEALARRLTALNDGAARAVGVSTGWSAHVRPLHGAVFGDIEPALRLAAAVAGLVFLAMAASTLGLLLARTMRRRGELAVRRALGAGARHIGRIVALEGAGLALCGGAAGIALGLLVGDRVLVASSGLVPLADRGGVARWGVVVGALATVGVGLLAAGLPAVVGRTLAHTTNPGRGARSGGPGPGGRRGRVLVAAQLALAFVLVATAASLVASLRALGREPLGFRSASAAAVRIALPSDRYADPAAVVGFYTAVGTALSSRLDVDAVGVGSDLPLGGAGSWGTAWTPGASDDDGVPVLQRTAAPGWFDAVGIEVLEGRDFTADDGAEARTVMVSRTLADALWPDGAAIGRRMAPRRDPDGAWATVVGVVEEGRYEGVEAPGRPQYYEPHRAAPWTEMYLVVRGPAAVRDPAARVRSVVAELDPQVPVEDHGPLERVVERATAPRRLTGSATVLFALGAVGVVGVGVVGTSGLAMDRRRREFAVRRAVGADAGGVLLALLRGTGWTAAVGVSVGLVGLWLLAPVTEGLLFGVRPISPGAVTLAAGALAVTASLAGLPALFRALAADPAEALRGD